ncbi:MAG: DUF3047 domain-containing protein [Limnobacter sp.]|nr:DUF3047 domain-containing protein [Limnobacter sp.]
MFSRLVVLGCAPLAANQIVSVFATVLLACLPAALVAAPTATPATAPVPLIAAWQTAGDFPYPWQTRFHPDIPKTTRFEQLELDRRPVLKASAQGSYGTLVHRFATPQPLQTLQWQWAVTRHPIQAALQTKEGDDAAAKVCLFVQIDESKLGLTTKLALGAARTLAREPLPAATLCYVWATPGDKTPEHFPNPYTDRVVNWVLQRQPASDNWVLEQRNVENDVRTVFGPVLPGAGSGLGEVRVTAVAIGADADNTQSESVAFFSTLQAQKNALITPQIPPTNMLFTTAPLSTRAGTTGRNFFQITFRAGIVIGIAFRA